MIKFLVLMASLALFGRVCNCQLKAARCYIKKETS